jgi:hypothetical protein
MEKDVASLPPACSIVILRNPPKILKTLQIRAEN